MSRYILALFISLACSVQAAFMLEIPTIVENASDKSVNILTQATGPSVDRYSGGPGWNYSSWIESNIQPGEKRNVKLYVFQENQAVMKAFVLSTEEDEVMSAQEMTGRYLKHNNYHYCGDITFYRDQNGVLKSSSSGFLDFSLEGCGGRYSAKLVVR